MRRITKKVKPIKGNVTATNIQESGAITRRVGTFAVAKLSESTRFELKMVATREAGRYRVAMYVSAFTAFESFAPWLEISVSAKLCCFNRTKLSDIEALVRERAWLFRKSTILES